MLTSPAHETSKTILASDNITKQNIVHSEASAMVLCNRIGIPGSDGPLNLISTNGQASTLKMFQKGTARTTHTTVYNVLVLTPIKIGQSVADQTNGPLTPIRPGLCKHPQF